VAHYVVLANFTDQGVRAVQETTKRAQGFRDLATKMGVTVKEIYWTFGHYDVVLTMEASDDEKVASLMFKVGSLGNLKSQTLRAFSEREMKALI